jgi:hypothetical protein
MTGRLWLAVQVSLLQSRFLPIHRCAITLLLQVSPRRLSQPGLGDARHGQPPLLLAGRHGVATESSVCLVIDVPEFSLLRAVQNLL